MANNKVDKKAIEAFIRKNPTASFSEFVRQNKGVPLPSDCTYYTLRRKMTGVIRDSRRKSNMYFRLFLVPGNEVSSEARTLLQKFLDALNVMHQTRMEMIEFGNPSQIEIREVNAP
jgi:hypothetical protein